MGEGVYISDIEGNGKLNFIIYICTHLINHKHIFDIPCSVDS